MNSPRGRDESRLHRRICCVPWNKYAICSRIQELDAPLGSTTPPTYRRPTQGSASKQRRDDPPQTLSASADAPPLLAGHEIHMLWPQLSSSVRVSVSSLFALYLQSDAHWTARPIDSDADRSPRPTLRSVLLVATSYNGHAATVFEGAEKRAGATIKHEGVEGSSGYDGAYSSGFR